MQNLCVCLYVEIRGHHSFVCVCVCVCMHLAVRWFIFFSNWHPQHELIRLDKIS